MYELQGHPGGGAAGEGEEDGVGGPHHGVARDGELELPEEVGAQALAAQADASGNHDDGADAALAAGGGGAGGDGETAQPLLRSIIGG